MRKHTHVILTPANLLLGILISRYFEGVASPLRPLIGSVYVPSAIYSVGASALGPAQVLLALKLGFSSAEVALIATLIGALSIVSSLASGYVVERLGERRALIFTTGIGLAGLIATFVMATTHAPAARWILILSLSLFDLTDAVWSIARQGIVAERVDIEHRGRALNTYGASQRLGRVIGPFVAAAVIAKVHSGGPATVFLVSVGFILVALVVMSRAVPPAAPYPHNTPTAAARPAAQKLPFAIPGFLTLGLGILALSAVRAAKDTLIPLWASAGLHLQDERVAFVIGVAAAMELVLFWPAGVALDKLGRTPVIVTCLLLMGTGLAVMPVSHSFVWFVAAAIVTGLGDGTGAGIIKTVGGDLAPPNARARFLGWWMAISSVGSFAAPAAASAVISLASLPIALPVAGLFGLAGAGWMAYWTPRFLPNPRRSS